jgi:hypothetical protein
MEFLDDNLLSLVTFLPLATGMALLVTSVLSNLVGIRGFPALAWRGAAVASTTVTFLLSLRLFRGRPS